MASPAGQCSNWVRWKAATPTCCSTRAFSAEDKLEYDGFARYRNWLDRGDLFAALERFGWSVKAVGYDEPGHRHGPAIAVIASRT